MTKFSHIEGDPVLTYILPYRVMKQLVQLSEFADQYGYIEFGAKVSEAAECLLQTANRSRTRHFLLVSPTAARDKDVIE